MLHILTPILLTNIFQKIQEGTDEKYLKPTLAAILLCCTNKKYEYISSKNKKNEKNKTVLKMYVLDIYNNTLQKDTKDK